MNRKNILLGLLTLFLSLSPIAAQINVDANVDQDSYEIGDIVNLSIDVSNNSGLHGIYFELDYDSTIFELISVENSILSGGFPEDGELLYANNPYKANNTLGSHVIVSYTLKGQGVEIENNGQLASMQFRVLKQDTDPLKSFKFDFSEYGIVDGTGAVVATTSWKGSRMFQVKSPYQGAKITIESPHYYKVFNKSDSELTVVNNGVSEEITCMVNTVFTQGNFKVKIYNQNSPGVDYVHATLGYLQNIPVKIESGLNTIIAELYNDANELISTSSTVTYLAPDTEFVKITSPSDHAFINSDMTEIEVQSPYTGVTVNHLPAKLISTTEGIHKYSVKLWLKKGFNTIKAEAKGPNNVVYTDEIDLYYRKNSDHFKLLLPSASESYRKEMELLVRGEIGSEYKANDNVVGSVKNRVTIDVIYTPDDYTKSASKIVDNLIATIAPVDSSVINSGANYVFLNSSRIDLSELRNGTLQVDVYKNREGNSWDDKLTRICYLNNDPLQIELVQPNVYSKDILDTFSKIDGFDELKNLQLNGNNNISSSVAIDSKGALHISSFTPIAEELSLNGFVDIVEANDKTLFGLQNSNGSISIYTKKPQDLAWSLVVTKSGLYGFDLEYTDKGLFLGASNLYPGSEDGLYLLENNLLKNVDLPIVLPHVQFLNFRDNKLYIYGNNYSHLYSFDVFNIESFNNNFKVNGIEKDSFANSTNIKQFSISNDLTTAVIRDENSNISFYKKSGSNFNAVNMPELSGSSEVKGNFIVQGDYSKGDYISYFIYGSTSDCEVVMHNRINGEFFRYNFNIKKHLGMQSTDILENVYIDFKKDLFNFVYSSGINHNLVSGQVFFDNIYSKKEKPLNTLAVTNKLGSNNLFISDSGDIYLNYGFKLNSNIHTSPLVNFYDKYDNQGLCNFNYINSDIDGITGFSFEVEPNWYMSDRVGFGFTLFDKTNSALTNYSLNNKTLDTFTETINENYTIRSSFDAFIGRYVIDVTFNKIQGDGKYLNFDIILNSAGNSTPKLYNLTVKKKIPVILSVNKESSSQFITLPIQGYIKDRTVKDVFIQNNRVPLERDGSFYYNYDVRTVQDKISINLNCENGAGEKSVLDFSVNIIESKNKIGNINFYDSELSTIPLTHTNGKFSLNSDKLYVSGSFFGLEGYAVGYKITTTDTANPVTLKTGLFIDDSTVNQVDVYTSLNVDNPGSGYKAGIFKKQVIELEPGEQRVIIYCENPDGKISEYEINNGYPIFNYNMPESEQKILFTCGGDIITEVNSGVNFSRYVQLPVYESGTAPNYVFTRDYTITGKFQTLYNTNIIVKSYTPGVLFSNGESQITVCLESGNRFTVPVTITMDSSIEKDFFIGFIPDSPLLTNKKTGFKISASKSFENTNFILDFSEINEANVIQDNQLPKIPIKLKFNRGDVPVPRYTEATFTLNYESENTITGWIVKDPGENDFYNMEDDEGNELFVTGLKPGINRISWILHYKNPISNTLDVMSSSSFDKTGMSDYFFGFNSPFSTEATHISFSKAFEDKLYGVGTGVEQLPTLSISKDKKTIFTLILNGKEIDLSSMWTGIGLDPINSKSEEITNYSFITTDLIQGRNTIEIVFREPYSTPEYSNYSFIYDDKPPVVSVESYKYSDDYSVLTDVSFYVDEANYTSAKLYIGNGYHPNSSPEITILGTDKYRLTWINISVANDPLNPVYAEVTDLAGNTRPSNSVYAFEAKERPVTDLVKEKDIQLPLFTGPPGFKNEINNDFIEHTKFAPDSYLPKNEQNFNTIIDNNNSLLFENFKYLTIHESSDITSREQIAINSDSIAVGDPLGINGGSVTIYKSINNMYQEVTTINHPQIHIGIKEFGGNVSIDNNIMVISAKDSANKPIFYIYENINSEWVYKSEILINESNPIDKLMVSNGNILISLNVQSSTRFEKSNYLYNYENNTVTELVMNPLHRKGSITVNDNTIATTFYSYTSAKLTCWIIVYKIINNEVIHDSTITTQVYNNTSSNYAMFSEIFMKSHNMADLSATDNLILQCENTAGTTVKNAWQFNGSSWLKVDSLPTVDGSSIPISTSMHVSRNKLVLTTLEYGIIYDYINGKLSNYKRIDYPSNGRHTIYEDKLRVFDDIVVRPGEKNVTYFSLSQNNKRSMMVDKTNFVFKLPKNAVSNFDSFKEAIGFDIYGLKQNVNTSVIEREPSVGFVHQKEKDYYIEGDYNYYYVVDVDNLKTEYSNILPTIFAANLPADYKAVNNGVLSTKYDDALLNGVRPDVYYVGDGATQLDSIRFYDDKYEQNGVRSLEHTNGSYIETRSTSTTESTLYFWLRPEEVGFGTDSYTKYYANKDTYKKVLSLAGIHLGYSDDQLKVYKTSTATQLFPVDPVSTVPNLTSPTRWNMVLLSFNNNIASLYINGQKVAASLGLSELDMKEILDIGASYNFTPVTGKDAGFYSIAKPVYVDKVLTDAEILRLATMYNSVESREKLYNFNSIADFGSENYQLRKIGISSTDHINTTQNADYKEPSTAGSLKASNAEENLLKLYSYNPNNTSEKCVILKKSTSFIDIGVDVTGTEHDFTIKPTDETSKYYFGNKTGNNGLKQSKWYSVSGTVKYLQENKEARLVLRINGKEQYKKLKEGYFHFIYDNSEELIPSETILYVETSGKITFSNDLVLNHGNYRLENDLQKSAASTKYIFDRSGSINFWYKPLGTNSKGYVNFPVTIFDSEYFKIGTKSINGAEAKYYLGSKDSSGAISTKISDKKVNYGWQFVELSYDFNEQLVYLYINGELIISNELQLNRDFGSVLGQLSTEDNIFIGCNNTKDSFAQGYIDDFYIGKYYSKSVYDSEKSALKFYSTEFKSINDNRDNSVELNIYPVNPPNIETYQYYIEKVNGEVVRKGSTNSFPITINSFDGGRYVVTTKLVVNGHEYLNKTAFNLNNKPLFSLQKQTPIIFKGNPTDLQFKFSYDRSYQFDTGENIYAGIEAKVLYNDGADSKTYYAVQDFQSRILENWLIGNETGGVVTWSNMPVETSGHVVLDIPNITSNTDVKTEIKYFYFKINFNDYNSAIEPLSKVIPTPMADIKYEIKKSNNIQYKIDVNLGAKEKETLDNTILNNLEIISNVTKIDDLATNSNSFKLNSDGTQSLYFDDILLRDSNGQPIYGNYKCSLVLKYLGAEILKRDVTEELIWEDVKVITNPEVRELEIDEFSLLYLDKNPNTSNSKASFVLKYKSKAIGEILADLEIIDELENVIMTYSNQEISNLLDVHVFENVEIPLGNYKVRVILTAEEFRKTSEVYIQNQANAPDVYLTNGVESKISYNNVYFSWKGFFEGDFNSEIQYQYQLDGKGWSEPSKDWRDIRYFNLDEGYHTFEVKALYNNKESNIVSQTFFVDIYRPEFNPEFIKVEEFRNSQDILASVKIIGNPGAITDASLMQVYIDGVEAYLDKTTNSFSSGEIMLKEDGINRITVTAYDKVGNFTDYVVEVDNVITTIAFPENGKPVLYSPMTIVGTIDSAITADMDIYLLDPFSSDSEDFSGWKKAKINEDRTFFVEDVLINSGSANNTIVSTLKLAVVFNTGEIFYRDINVSAKEIVMPIEMSLSTRAAEGENEDTYVEINCKANVSNISSWSIDYNGDGIYDEIDLVKNPESIDSRSHFWSHKYSSIDMFKPRVRVVTVDGNFFSVSDTIIIHEKIKDASPNLVLNPISVSSVKTHLQDHKVFVLREENLKNIIDVYRVRKHLSRMENTGEKIYLDALNINDAVLVRALNEDNLFVVSNKEGVGTVSQVKANSFGNYIKERTLKLPGHIKDLTLDSDNIYISFVDNSDFVKVNIIDGLLDIESQTTNVIETPYTNNIGKGSHISKDSQGLMLSDYDNSRLVRISDNFNLIEQFGSFGDKGGEFITPGNIKTFGDRIMVYDERRQDIQIFDSQFNEQCTLQYNSAPGYHNYVEYGFFNDIADFDLIAKEEGDRLYYYALVLSKSSGMLSMLRLPQYQELRARVRNNRVVFIKNGEVFTSKPDGSDILRILSTDSIPRIEGTLDYPALSPDGRSLIFTSRVKLYNSGYDPNSGEQNPYEYDNIYRVNIETQELEKLDLGIINNYAIERPVFNSNGDKIIFSAKKPGEKWQIWIYSLVDQSVTKLFTSDENVRFPYYSPDDRFVVFTTDYDGDEDIDIVDTENTTIRTTVTKNFARDSLPVWSPVYPEEISNPDFKVDSKISFVSERNFHKGVYVVYLSRPDESDIRIFNIKTSLDGGDTEAAVVEITNSSVEGDYPCFTGDGKDLFFEYFDGNSMMLKRFTFDNVTNQDEFLKANPNFVYEDVEILYGASRPAGMKNTITNFSVENKNGDQLVLNWDRYTNTDIFYTVQLMEPTTGGGYNLIEKKVSSQTGTTLQGLKLGYKYNARVCIIENEKVVTASQWKNVRIPDVIARPSFSISEQNPYLVNLEGWAPANTERTGWKYTWIIDNTPYTAGESRNMAFEFSTSGTKIIQLKVEGTSSTGPETAISEPFEVKIISDIVPVIEATVSQDSKSVILDASGSLGEKINNSSAMWTITGPGDVAKQFTGITREIDITNYQKRIYVTLTLDRIAVNGQTGTDKLETTKVIDLDIKEVLPVINTTISEANNRIIIFDGTQSIGNINWPNAQWSIMANGTVIGNANGVSSFSHFFPETNSDTVYSVSLTAPRKSDGSTVTTSKIISVEAAPIEPVIEYTVIHDQDMNGQISNAKVVLDCTKSLGSNIDFSQAKWTLPVAGQYGEQPTQFGPTAVFTLNTVTKGAVIEVNLALAHRGGTDYKTTTQLITIDQDQIPVSELYINEEITETINGKTVKLDAYNSTGGNIDWEKTTWTVEVPGVGQTTLRGPVAQIPVGDLPEDSELTYNCTVYRHGGSSQSKSGSIILQAVVLKPIFDSGLVSDTDTRFYKINVFNTKGTNIDWERTEWSIHDGSGTVVQKRGGEISHHFPETASQMGYPVHVKMYLKGSSYPVVGYTSIDVDGDIIEPIINYSIDPNNSNIMTFSATSSSGSNIKWSNTKWTFGDSSQPKYGSVVEHKFPLNNDGKTYRVSMTLTRVMFNGSNEETFTTTKEIKIGADKMKAVVKANVVDGFLVLSASESEGQGLLLDRSTWLFPGEGDNSSTSNHTESGTIKRSQSSSNTNYHASAAVGFDNRGASLSATVSGVTVTAPIGVFATHDTGAGHESNKGRTTDIIRPGDDYINRNDSFSSSNSHTGAVCRRSIGNEKNVTVALTVFRMTSDGGTEAETVYVKVDIDKAKTSASGTGVVYGK